MDLIHVYVWKIDTDVVVLLVAFTPEFLKIKAGAQVIATCGVATGKYCILINVIAESITLERCEELLSLHALLVSNYRSSYFHVIKVKLMVSEPGHTKDIYLFGWLPSREEDINVVERLVISLVMMILIVF